MTPGSAGCVHLPVRRALDKVREETGELAFGNILFRGLIMFLATAAEEMGLNRLAA